MLSYMLAEWMLMSRDRVSTVQCKESPQQGKGAGTLSWSRI
jgi:hypothetical protein